MKKWNKKAAAVLLAVLTFCTIVLSGCSKEEPAPADQVVGAMYDLCLKDDPKPMMDLLGFASEDDVRTSLMEDSDTTLADVFEEEFASAGIEFTDEELQEMSDTIMKLVQKLTYTAAISEQSKDETTVVLTVKSFSNADIQQTMTDLQTEYLENMDEETQAALMSGDEDAIMEFTRQIMKDYVSRLGELEPNGGESEITVKCEKMKVDVSGKEKVSWMPVDMDKFTEDVDNSTFK